MSDRYTRLISVDGPLWVDGSPVMIEKGALLSDTVSGRNLLQLKLRNIQALPLKAVVVGIELLDVTNAALGNTEHSYLDLAVGNGGSFGDDTPIWLDVETARGFRFSLKSVAFSDGSTWNSSSVAMEVTPADGLEMLGELRYQFTREIAALSALLGHEVTPSVVPTDRDGVWYCTCGALNADSNVDCWSCGLDHDRQKAISEQGYLSERTADFEMRAAATRAERELEEREQQEKKEAQHKKASKTRRVALAVVAAVVVVTVILTTVVFPEVRYSAAVSDLRRGDFAKAESSFAELGSYRDSRYMVYETQLQQARHFADGGNYPSALSSVVALQTRLSGKSVPQGAISRSDEAGLLSEARAVQALCEYQLGTQRLKNKDYATAAIDLQICVSKGGYKDAAAQLAEAQRLSDSQTKYQQAVQLMGSSFKSAKAILETLPPGYADVSSRLATINRASPLMGTYRVRSSTDPYLIGFGGGDPMTFDAHLYGSRNLVVFVALASDGTPEPASADFYTVSGHGKTISLRGMQDLIGDPITQTGYSGKFDGTTLTLYATDDTYTCVKY